MKRRKIITTLTKKIHREFIMFLSMFFICTQTYAACETKVITVLPAIPQILSSEFVVPQGFVLNQDVLIQVENEHLQMIVPKNKQSESFNIRQENLLARAITGLTNADRNREDYDQLVRCIESAQLMNINLCIQAIRAGKKPLIFLYRKNPRLVMNKDKIMSLFAQYESEEFSSDTNIDFLELLFSEDEEEKEHFRQSVADMLDAMKLKQPIPDDTFNKKKFKIVFDTSHIPETGFWA